MSARKPWPRARQSRWRVPLPFGEARLLRGGIAQQARVAGEEQRRGEERRQRAEHPCYGDCGRSSAALMQKQPFQTVRTAAPCERVRSPLFTVRWRRRPRPAELTTQEMSCSSLAASAEGGLTNPHGRQTLRRLPRRERSGTCTR
jgi:hypothetical protein